mmetsp:Transcript_63861/g.113947  ORF Transcript_63861/g.113947 Transcript_63861/m.113947 type:complete len:295 (+) Transcript_63861:60-944(+)
MGSGVSCAQCGVAACCQLASEGNIRNNLKHYCCACSAASVSSMWESCLTVDFIAVSGERLLEQIVLDEKTSSFKELARQAADVLDVQLCKLVSSSGVELKEGMSFSTAGLSDGDQITVVAINEDPLLQLVGFQDAEGNHLNSELSFEDRERIAIDVASTIVKKACWFGKAGDVNRRCGYPTVAWVWAGAAPMPPFKQLATGVAHCVVRPTMNVIHAGATLIVSLAQDLPGYEAGPSVQLLSAAMTVNDLVGLRDNLGNHIPQEQFNFRKTLRLVSYTREEVHMELGNRYHHHDF